MVRCEPGELSELCHVSRRRRRRGRWARTRPSPTTTSTTPPTPTRRRSWRSWTRPSPASNFPPHLPQMRPGPSQTGERRRDDGQTEHEQHFSQFTGEKTATLSRNGHQRSSSRLLLPTNSTSITTTSLPSSPSRQVASKQKSCCSCCCLLSVFCCVLVGFLAGISLGVLAYR